MTNHAAMRLGKRPPVHDSRSLLLANYIDDSALKPHPRIDWGNRVTSLGMMKNDELGDCTCAGAGHMIQTWTANNGNQVIIPDSAIVKAYQDVGGYVPGDPSTDNGAVELDLLNYWRKTGIGGHKIFAFVSQEPGNRQHIELSVDLLGGCYLGIALPISAQRQRVWSVPPGGLHGDGAPGSWGGHAVPIVAYGPTGPICITWGQFKTMTWSFFKAYVDEGYGVLSSDWATGAKVAPSGFRFDQLQKDLALIAH